MALPVHTVHQAPKVLPLAWFSGMNIIHQIAGVIVDQAWVQRILMNFYVLNCNVDTFQFKSINVTTLDQPEEIVRPLPLEHKFKAIADV